MPIHISLKEKLKKRWGVQRVQSRTRPILKLQLFPINSDAETFTASEAPVAIPSKSAANIPQPSLPPLPMMLPMNNFKSELLSPSTNWPPSCPTQQQPLWNWCPALGVYLLLLWGRVSLFLIPTLGINLILGICLIGSINGSITPSLWWVLIYCECDSQLILFL